MIFVELLDNIIVGGTVYLLFNIIIGNDIILLEIKSKITAHTIIRNIFVIEHELKVDKVRTQQSVSFESVHNELIQFVLNSFVDNLVCEIRNLILLDHKSCINGNTEPRIYTIIVVITCFLFLELQQYRTRILIDFIVI